MSEMAVRYLWEESEGITEPAAERRQTLPEYLRQLRVLNHYRQSFVASKLNISRQTYSHYETGRIRPPAGALYGLAKLYEVPVERLLSCMMFGKYGIESQEEKQENIPEYKAPDDRKEHLKNENCQKDEKDFKRIDLKGEGSSSLEIQLLSHFRNLNEGERKEILSIIELKIKNKGEKENRDAECKVTV